MTTRRLLFALAATLAAGASALNCLAMLADDHKPGYKDTPFLPGGKWRVHDADRPHPPVVKPGEKLGDAPADAVVLFDGKDLSQWRGDHGDPTWNVKDGVIVAKGGSGSLISREEFGDAQIHIEWAAPNPPKGNDQGRGNSGVLIFGRYEIQVLDNYDNPTYADGHAGAVYGQHPPLVNALRPPGEWQSYDILFTAPKFKDDGSVEIPAYVTVLVNGVVVQNHAEIYGSVAFRDLGRYQKHGPKGPILLQDHGNPVRFRNIWVRPMDKES